MLLSNLNISLECMRFVQHVSCNNFAPATDINVEILQDQHGELRHVLGCAVDPGTLFPSEALGVSEPLSHAVCCKFVSLCTEQALTALESLVCS